RIATTRLERFSRRSRPSRMSSGIIVPDLRNHPDEIHEPGHNAKQQEDDLQRGRAEPPVEQISDAVADHDGYRKDHADAQDEIQLLERSPLVVFLTIH